MEVKFKWVTTHGSERDSPLYLTDSLLLHNPRNLGGRVSCTGLPLSVFYHQGYFVTPSTTVVDEGLDLLHRRFRRILHTPHTHPQPLPTLPEESLRTISRVANVSGPPNFMVS